MNAVRSGIEEAHCRWLARRYDFNGFKRIYLIHNRKTGGTSLNFMLLSLAGTEPEPFYERLARTPSHRLVLNGKVFVGWNIALINAGHYFHAFSHTPVHGLKLPGGTFTVSCFRDPVERVVSHYKMLRHYQRQNIAHPCMETEGKWLGRSFQDFLEKMPREHLLNQVYMFSEKFEVQQALERALQVSHRIFLDRFASGVAELNRKTGLNLRPLHARKAALETDIPADDLLFLREKLNLEYAFLDQLRRADLEPEAEACIPPRHGPLSSVAPLAPFSSGQWQPPQEAKPCAAAIEAH